MLMPSLAELTRLVADGSLLGGPQPSCVRHAGVPAQLPTCQNI